MAKNNIDAKETMLEHSKAKVELYSRYLAKYLNIISRDKYTKQINIYDLFCGEGIYKNGGKGSPIAAIETIKKYYDTNSNTINLKLLFNDIEKSKIDKLKAYVSEISIPITCKISYEVSEYEKIVAQTKLEIKEYKNEKGIIFIDPYGYKEIKIQDIKDLLQAKKTEVLLFLPISFMYRFIKKANTAEELPYIEPLKKILNSLYGIQHLEFTSEIKFIESLKEKLKEFLKTFYVDTFVLQRDTKKSYFCLFFFSSHIKGFETMLRTKWELDNEQGAGFKYQPQQNAGLLFAPIEISGYAYKLEKYLRENKRYNAEVYEFGLYEGHLPEHTNEIFREWQRIGKLKVLNDENTKVRANSFYLNYDTYKEEPKKVYFKIL